MTVLFLWKVINVSGSCSHAMRDYFLTFPLPLLPQSPYTLLIINIIRILEQTHFNLFLLCRALQKDKAWPQSTYTYLRWKCWAKQLHLMLICEFPVNCIFVTFHLTLTVQNLWLPDVEILDLKAFETHSVLSKLEGWEDFLKTQNWTTNENAACAQICSADEDSLDMSKLIIYFQKKMCCNLLFCRNLDRLKFGGHVCACYKVIF